ncbi:hypothetical protein V3W47_01965 [Deinococcus sp. YIM 134068]|uniref:hypothetical protein n=1 Tax=Deinococcus lichenicola TaxID=3118910 RepID=UPI002F94594A
MTWDGLLLGASAALGLLLVLMPAYSAVRSPAALPWGRAALVLGASLLAVPVLTLVFSLVFTLVGNLVPGLNPFRGPAFEPVDAGLFSLFVGLAVALTVICLVQFRWLRARVGRR